jgi:hypothetical protein
MILYFPAVMLAFDSPRYARLGSMAFFGDFWIPAGYPLLLLGLRAITQELWFTIAVQHFIGLGTGALLFLAVRRLAVPRWVACLPAAVAFLSGDHLYLEHIVMADFFLTFLTAAGLTAAVFGLVEGGSLRWLAAASALLASAALARSVGIVLLPILVVCAGVWTKKPWRSRLATLSAALLPGLAVFVTYIGAFLLAGGEYLGLSDMRGWNLYSRVAPFADCEKFQPPTGTIVLCEQRAPAERPGPFGYVWDLESVPRKTFTLGPATGKKLGAFAHEAILHQPIDYLRAVAIDLARYIEPSVVKLRPYSGQPRELISFGWRDLEVERMVVNAMSWGYRGTTVRLRGQEWLGRYQRVTRVGGFLLLACLLFTFLGMATARGTLRLGTFLFGWSALGLYALPVLTVSYDFRYGIPPETFLVVSGTLGALAGWERFVKSKTVPCF